MIEKLLKKEPYQLEFQKLRSKLRKGKIRLSDYELNESITLRWTLYNEDFITKEIIKNLKEKSYTTPIAIEKKVNINDKERLLYAFDWHEKILQSAVAELLTSAIEPFLSDSLNSYRKGRGSYNTLMQLSNYIKSFKEEQSIFILKRDIKSYGDNIPHEKLSKILENYIQKEDYLFQLIMQIIKFKYHEHTTGTLKQKDIGLPTGSPINNIIVNMFLMDMDSKIDSYKDKSCYFRYGDDILVATPDKNTADKISKLLYDSITDKELIFNEDKKKDLIFDKTEHRDETFKYLGLMVKNNGELTLTKEKDKKIRDNIKQTLTRIYKMTSKITKNKDEKVKSLIKATRSLFYKTDFLASNSIYFPIVNDDKYWEDLDLWIAKIILNSVYEQQGDRVFAKYPFKKLRQKGLPSLRHLRRLYLDDKERFYKYINVEPE